MPSFVESLRWGAVIPVLVSSAGIKVDTCACQGCAMPTIGHKEKIKTTGNAETDAAALSSCIAECDKISDSKGCIRVHLSQSGCKLYDKAAEELKTGGKSGEMCWVKEKKWATTLIGGEPVTKKETSTTTTTTTTTTVVKQTVVKKTSPVVKQTVKLQVPKGANVNKFLKDLEALYTQHIGAGGRRLFSLTKEVKVDYTFELPAKYVNTVIAGWAKVEANRKTAMNELKNVMVKYKVDKLLEVSNLAVGTVVKNDDCAKNCLNVKLTIRIPDLGKAFLFVTNAYNAAMKRAASDKEVSKALDTIKSEIAFPLSMDLKKVLMSLMVILPTRRLQGLGQLDTEARRLASTQLELQLAVSIPPTFKFDVTQIANVVSKITPDTLATEMESAIQKLGLNIAVPKVLNLTTPAVEYPIDRAVGANSTDESSNSVIHRGCWLVFLPLAMFVVHA